MIGCTVQAIVLMCAPSAGIDIDTLTHSLTHTTTDTIPSLYRSASNRMEMKMRIRVWISMRLSENRNTNNKNWWLGQKFAPIFFLAISCSYFFLLPLIPDILLPVHPPRLVHKEFCIRLWREHIMLYVCVRCDCIFFLFYLVLCARKIIWEILLNYVEKPEKMHTKKYESNISGAHCDDLEFFASFLSYTVWQKSMIFISKLQDFYPTFWWRSDNTHILVWFHIDF